MTEPGQSAPDRGRRPDGGLLDQTELMLAALMGLAFLVLGVTIGWLQGDAEQESARRALEQRGQAVATSLVAGAPVAWFLDGEAGLAELAAKVKTLEDLSHLLFLDQGGKLLLAQTGTAGQGLEPAVLDKIKRELKPGAVARAIGGRPVLEVVAQVEGEEAAAKDGSDRHIVVGASTSSLGHIVVGLSLARVERMSAVSGSLAWGLLLALLGGGAVALILRWRCRLIADLAVSLEACAAGDLSRDLPEPGSGARQALVRAINQLLADLRRAIGTVRGTIAATNQQVQTLLQASAQHAAAVRQQAAALQETQTTMQEINQTAQQATERAQTVVEAARRAEHASEEGQQSAEEAVAGMADLRTRSEDIARQIVDLAEQVVQIGEIMASVKELAEQSNILAVNASMEAARAGEQGKGFAVVAVEMRNLAEQSKQSVAQVREIVTEIHDSVRKAVIVTEQGGRDVETGTTLTTLAGEAILHLAEVLRDSMDSARQIAASTKQQSVGVDQVFSAIGDINDATGTVVESTADIQVALDSLRELCEETLAAVSHYRLA